MPRGFYLRAAAYVLVPYVVNYVWCWFRLSVSMLSVAMMFFVGPIALAGASGYMVSARVRWFALVVSVAALFCLACVLGDVVLCAPSVWFTVFVAVYLLYRSSCDIAEREGVAEPNPLAVWLAATGVLACFFDGFFVVGVPAVVGSLTYLVLYRQNLLGKVMLPTLTVATSLALLSLGAITALAVIGAFIAGRLEAVAAAAMLAPVAAFLLAPPLYTLYAVFTGRKWPIAQLYSENIVDTLLEAFKKALERRGLDYRVAEKLKILWPLTGKIYEIYVPQLNLKVNIREWVHRAYIGESRIPVETAPRGTIAYVNTSPKTAPKEVKEIIKEALEEAGLHGEARAWEQNNS